ncbi:MOSC domain-containing protein [Candidatus Halobonum tyrrellensis]|uniref:MOSC domain-containing protein n=1 Tax=Candidatus Halobonum tyrrellensis TaxID=1431545 RepID=UPI001F39455F|nr:MOSC N-terminal beta barrel domain-containing protein [Candidatus Halobonum tyrrellensis]
MTSTPRLGRITVFPVKSLPGSSRETVRLVDGGALEHDREFAVVDADGEYVNGKRTDAVHGLDAAFDPAADELRFRVRESVPSTGALDPGDAGRFALPDERAAAEAWLGEFFGFPVELRRDRAGGHPDTTDYATGPSVVSAATLRTVASWFDGLDADGVRRRLRANLEVENVPAFWEDRLVGSAGRVVPFEVGGVELEGVRPCPRCVVPSRDPETGERYERFRETFVERREATFPEWATTDRFDHMYSLMVHTAAPAAAVGADLAVGDPVTVGEERPERPVE